MGAIHFSIDARLLRLLARELPLDVFVETGTYEGESVQTAAPLFPELHTIELGEDLAAAAERRFEDIDAVHVHRGRSEQQLAELVPTLGERPTLFWLDAHWSEEPDAVGGDGQCPLLSELAAIGSIGPGSVVMIDDARLFLAPPPLPAEASEWPDLDQVLEALRKLSPEHELLVIDDVIVFFPSQIREALREHAVEHATDSLAERGETHATAAALQRLESKLDKLARRSAAGAEQAPALRDEIRALDGRLAGLHEQLEDAQRGLQSLGAEARITRQAVSEMRLVEARQELRALAGRVDAIGSGVDSTQAQITGGLDGLQGELEARLARLDMHAQATRATVTRLRDEHGANNAAVAHMRAEVRALSEGLEAVIAAQQRRDRRWVPLQRLSARALGFLARLTARPRRAVGRLWHGISWRLRGAGVRWGVRLGRLRPRPKLGVLQHHPPVPLKVPDRYLSETPPERPPAISIVTPSYNQGRYLQRTVESVLNQGYPGLEYVVQDGDSTDQTRAVLERFDGRLHRWEMREDEGQAHAINLGMAHTSGEIMAYLNSDDLLLPGSLCYVARYFAEHSDVDAIYGHRVLIDEDDQEIGRWVLPRHGDEVLSWADFVPQETLFWRRSVWDRAGARMDEDFRYALDWDLILRLRDAGARIVRTPRFLGAFRVHTEQKTTLKADSAGAAEMALIRAREHDHEVSNGEVGRELRWYLRRHVVLHKLYRAGVIRY